MNGPENRSGSTSGAGTVDFRFEVLVIPVSDVDRAKQFYTSIGWREDADFPIREDLRIVQMTPPGSPTSVIFGTGVSDAEPGSYGSMVLAVYDVDAARADLASRGVDISEVFHGSAFDLKAERLPGRDPDGKSYSSWASFSDPDGNGWLLQEIKTRLPGRGSLPIDELADLLHETSERHGAFEAITPPHDWWDWYAAYMTARQTGLEPDAASSSADRYMAEVKHVVPR